MHARASAECTRWSLVRMHASCTGAIPSMCIACPYHTIDRVTGTSTAIHRLGNSNGLMMWHTHALSNRRTTTF